ncbi:MAG: hypothetical protein H7836_14055 [Magnetococcus sp. YQC-3]
MKVKFKLSIEQFKQLLNYIHAAVNDSITHFDELQLLNLRAFLASGFKKLIDLQSALMFAPLKQKTFSFDVNQVHIVLSLLHRKRDLLDPYMLTVYNDLTAQNKTFFTLTNNY